VQNQSDGNVLMEAQGEDVDVERLLAQIRGAMGRNIVGEYPSPVPPDGEEKAFVIRH